MGLITQHVITIVDDESVEIVFAAADLNMAEAGGAQSYDVTLTGTMGVTLAIPVSAQVSDATTGTATPSQPRPDYSTITPTTITFPALSAVGATSTASVTVLDDSLYEGNETIILSLGSPTGNGVALGSPNEMTITVVDDDVVEVHYDTASSSVAENAGPAQITVSLTAISGVQLAIDLAVPLTDAATGTALSAGIDYGTFAPTITFTTEYATG